MGGLADTTRGTLRYCVSIDDKKISHYNIITPSAWNCSLTDSMGVRGVIEQVLIDTEIKNPEQLAEMGKIVRSYDPAYPAAHKLLVIDFNRWK